MEQNSYVMYPCITFLVLGGNSHCEKTMNLLNYMNFVSMCLQLSILDNSSVLMTVAVGVF
jgi:hypothetical protein